MRIRITKRRLLFAAIITLAVLFIGFEVFLLSPDFRRLFVGGAERAGADEALRKIVYKLGDTDAQVNAALSQARPPGTPPGGP